MLSARQLLLMRRARDRAVLIAVAPLRTVVLLPDPDFRRRVFRRVSHVGSRMSRDRLTEWIERRAYAVQSLFRALSRHLIGAIGIRFSPGVCYPPPPSRH